MIVFSPTKGDAKAAQERMLFLRRDVDQAGARLRDSERAAGNIEKELALLGERDPELWGASFVFFLQQNSQCCSALSQSMHFS